MSRSYKHTPIIKISHRNTKRWKRLASKTARVYDLSDGTCYKKTFEAHDICLGKRNFYRRFKTGRDTYTKLPPNMEDIREYWNK